ncbi:olfactory receptor 6F1-like [Heteronotia binoei]|uniref:olfactory receptor 6F1-like n=1 Tax=Heteronotia binoei TaxID=13085 RepID=UPI00292CDDA7|nr:olfactory receptor 6F1-like [Heteronotia binoei]
MGIYNPGGKNGTTVMEFILLGFPGSHYLQTVMFILFLIIYILTVFGNVSIIILVKINHQLHTPMYLFLCNLSFLEVWCTTASIPKILAIFLGKSRSISFIGCILQMYFVFFSFGSTEQFLLSIMAYDRYLAICHPLHYNTVMDISFSSKLAFGSWLCGFLVVVTPALLIPRLSFCESNVINNFYCSIDSWIVLSCTDTYAIEIVSFVTAIIVIIGSCLMTFLSYIYIISTILCIPSTKGRHKAFSTCSSHLANLIIWYGFTIFLFVKPSKQASLEITKIVNILSLIVVPLLNPFIYTLRNKEVKGALRNLLHWGCDNNIVWLSDKEKSSHNNGDRLYKLRLQIFKLLKQLKFI